VLDETWRREGMGTPKNKEVIRNERKFGRIEQKPKRGKEVKL
jgi:hypothetical protein